MKNTTIRLFISMSVLILLGFIWGSGYAIARYAMTNGVSPLGYAFWQSLGPALLTTFLVFLRRDKMGLGWRHWRFYLICGLLGIALPNTNMYFAAQYLPSGLLAVVINTVALIVYPLALFFRQERADGLRLLGVVGGVVGIILLVFPPGGIAINTASTLHLLMALLTPLLFALCAIYTARANPKEVDALMLAAGMLLMSSLWLMPVIWTSHSFYLLHWPLLLPDKIILLEIVLSTIGYVLFFILIRLAGPVYYSLVNGVVALTGLFWGKVIFHETFTPSERLAVAIIICGIVLVSLRQSQAPAARP